MNLPIFFDIVIGLFFIYLILSLLASEVQELIATLLQWRARHLKKAMEALLSGGSEYFSKNEVEKALSEGEKPKAEVEEALSEVDKARKLVIALYNDPLINTLNHQANEGLEQKCRLQDNLPIANKNSAPSYIPSETFASTLFKELKLPHLIEKTTKNKELKTDLILILSSYKELKTAIKNKDSESYRKIVKIYGEIDKEFEKLINELPADVPEPLIKSLEVLARRSQNKVEEIDEQLNQLRKEVETWFDRSMDRATGLYKRNAKGVAILIGIVIAIFTNTDTFHIISRLSRDTALRTAITSSASQQAGLLNDPAIRKKIDKSLDDVSLPLGWTDNNFKQQFGFDIADFTQFKFSFWNLLKSFRVLFGWLLSGFAIAMGAPFWFDLLGKVINVRNAGPRPESYTKDRPSLNKN